MYYDFVECMYDFVKFMNDFVECMYDFVKCMDDYIEWTYALVECMHDLVEWMYALVDVSTHLWNVCGLQCNVLYGLVEYMNSKFKVLRF